MQHPVAVFRFEWQHFAQPPDHRLAVAIQIEHRKNRKPSIEEEGRRVPQDGSKSACQITDRCADIVVNRIVQIPQIRFGESRLETSPEVLKRSVVARTEPFLKYLRLPHALFN